MMFIRVSTLLRGLEHWGGGGRHDARCWVLRDRDACPGFGLGSGLFLRTLSCRITCGGVGYRPYFENYTVDASILNLTDFGPQITKIYL